MKQTLPALLPEALRTSASRVALNPGQMLSFQGDPVEYIYYVLSGEVMALRHLPDGTEAVMQRARADEFFAQSAMLMSHYACDAKATAATDVARLPVRQLAQALTSDGAFALAFSARLAGDLRRQCTRVERLLMKIGLDPSTVSRLITDLRASGEVVGTGRHIRLATRAA